ncbi:MAG TPA: type II toxin-antitoxin system RelE/ParE family toxin [Thiopseudomonas sp.]|nr:type II toxin-antitoxin system RelE/ParE family toxin [Thiopseudomonas sp.]
MTYRLQFDPRALKEWSKLGHTVKDALRKKLKKVLQAPRVDKHKLVGFADCYKIKLRNDGYRLVYQVKDDALIVLVIAIGKRENSAAYEAAQARLD